MIEKLRPPTPLRVALAPVCARLVLKARSGMDRHRLAQE
jgi:hypothetical protein